MELVATGSIPGKRDLVFDIAFKSMTESSEDIQTLLGRYRSPFAITWS